MKFYSLIATTIIILLSPAAMAQLEVKAPIVAGKIQYHANCIQCGGRFVCGHTEQYVKLKYLRAHETLNIQEHCAKKSHDISESIRINDGARTEEAVRYQDYFKDILEPINKNKGGKLRYKQEKGFLFADLFRFVDPIKNLPKNKKEKKLKKAKATVNNMIADRVLLPILSIEEFRDIAGSSKRLDIEYQQYVKNLLLLHPSELEERPMGSGLYVKATKVDTSLKAKFAANFGKRASGMPNLAASGASGPGGAEATNPQAPKDSDQKRGVANIGGADQIILDENLNVINAKQQKKEREKAAAEASRVLLQKSLNEQSAKRVQQLPKFGGNLNFKNYSYNRNIQSAYDFLAEVNRTGDSSLCDVGSTSASQASMASGSAKVAAAYGADSSLENGSVVAPRIQNQASSALNSSSAEECRFKIKSIFNSPEDFKLIAGVADDASSAETVVKQEESRRESGLFDIGNETRTRSVASSVPSTGVDAADVVVSDDSGITTTIAGMQVLSGNGNSSSSYNVATSPPISTKTQGANSKKGSLEQNNNDSIELSSSNRIAFEEKKVVCNDWLETLSNFSEQADVSCAQKEILRTCKANADKDLQSVCKKTLRFIQTEKCLKALYKNVRADSNSVDYYFKKHPALKLITPHNIKKGEAKTNSLWEVILIAPDKLSPKDSKSVSQENLCKINKFLYEDPILKSHWSNLPSINIRQSKKVNSRLDELLSAFPIEKRYLESVYGKNMNYRLAKLSGLKVECHQFSDLVKRESQEIDSALNELNKVLVEKIDSRYKPKNVSQVDMKKLIRSFTVNYGFPNANAFGEYNTGDEKNYNSTPFSLSFLSKLRKLSNGQCSNDSKERKPSNTQSQ